jgi:hypothetical protein
MVFQKIAKSASAVRQWQNVRYTSNWGLRRRSERIWNEKYLRK